MMMAATVTTDSTRTTGPRRAGSAGATPGVFTTVAP